MKNIKNFVLILGIIDLLFGTYLSFMLLTFQSVNPLFLLGVMYVIFSLGIINVTKICKKLLFYGIVPMTILSIVMIINLGLKSAPEFYKTPLFIQITAILILTFFCLTNIYLFNKLDVKSIFLHLSRRKTKLNIAYIYIFTGLILFFIFCTFRGICRKGPIPDKLREQKILNNSLALKKELVLDNSRIGDIGDILRGRYDYEKGQGILVSGSTGFVFLDDTWNTKLFISFGRELDNVEIINVERDGICEFLNRGGWGSPCSLIDHNGKELWRYDNNNGINDTDAGDIDNNGILDFIVGCNGSGGVHLLNSKGKRIWKRRDVNVWHVEFADVNQDGILEIIHSNAEGLITIRDKDGKILRRNKPDSQYIGKFALTKWPKADSAEYILCEEGGIVWILDFNGKMVTKYDLGECSIFSSYNVNGIPVHLRDNEGDYFAVLVMYLASWDRSMLYIYNSDKKVVYQELLPESCESIAAIKINSSSKDVLLVGGRGKIWQYKIES